MVSQLMQACPAPLAEQCPQTCGTCPPSTSTIPDSTTSVITQPPLPTTRPTASPTDLIHPTASPTDLIHPTASPTNLTSTALPDSTSTSTSTTSESPDPVSKVKMELKFEGLTEDKFVQAEDPVKKALSEETEYPKEKISLRYVASRRRRLVESTVEAQFETESNAAADTLVNTI